MRLELSNIEAKTMRASVNIEQTFSQKVARTASKSNIDIDPIKKDGTGKSCCSIESSPTWFPTNMLQRSMQKSVRETMPVEIDF